MPHIIVKKTRVFKHGASDQEVVPYREIYVYPRGKRDSLEVTVTQEQHWYDDARWKQPTLNWCAAMGGQLTIKQAKVFLEVLVTALSNASDLRGPEQWYCPQCHAEEPEETCARHGPNGYTQSYKCERCGCEFRQVWKSHLVFEGREIVKKGRKKCSSKR